MSNQIDYAKMIEIPVNTLNVMQKKSKRKKQNFDELKNQTLQAVNERTNIAPQTEIASSEESVLEEGRFTRSEQVLRGKKFWHSKKEAKPNTPASPKTEKTKIDKLVMVEFILVCVFCAIIFITNLFVPNSVINSYARDVFFPEEVATIDEREYYEFELNATVSPLAQETVLSVGTTGVMSFTGKGSIYSPCDGKIKKITEQDGFYNVEVQHSSLFSTIIAGLKYIYVAVGDSVYSNVPVGYSEGASPVNISMYNEGELLNCYSVNENNSLVWKV